MMVRKILLLLFVSFTLSFCNSKNKVDKAKMASVSAAEAPVFKFEELSHDFGNLKLGEKVSYTFKFKNIGKTPLVITNAKASCGCTVPKYENKLVEPNTDGFVEVTFNSSSTGMQYKTIKVFANTIPEVHELKITANVAENDK